MHEAGRTRIRPALHVRRHSVLPAVKRSCLTKAMQGIELLQGVKTIQLIHHGDFIGTQLADLAMAVGIAIVDNEALVGQDPDETMRRRDDRLDVNKEEWEAGDPLGVVPDRLRRHPLAKDASALDALRN